MPTYNFDNYTTINMNGTEMFQVKYGAIVVYNKTLINFDERGGGAVSNKYVHYKRQYGTLPSTSKSYSTFNGWYTGVNQTGSQILSTTVLNSVTASQTLYAAWTPSQSGYYANKASLNLTYNTSGTVILYAYSGATSPSAYYWYFSDITSGNGSITNSTSQTVTVKNTNTSGSSDLGYIYCRITVDGKYLYYSVALTLQTGTPNHSFEYLGSSTSQSYSDYQLPAISDPAGSIGFHYNANNYGMGSIIEVEDSDQWGTYYYFEIV